MGNPNPSKKFTSETARLAGRKSKRRPYDLIRRAKLEKLIEREIQKPGGQKVKMKMSRDDWYDWAIDQIILNREAGAVSAIREQRNRAYGHAPLHLKFDDDEENPEDKIPLRILKQIERLLEKSSRGD